jgi:hypothetical protein
MTDTIRSSRLANEQSAVRLQLSRQYIHFFLPLFLCYVVQLKVYHHNVINVISYVKCSNVTELKVNVAILF